MTLRWSGIGQDSVSAVFNEVRTPPLRVAADAGWSDVVQAEAMAEKYADWFVRLSDVQAALSGAPVVHDLVDVTKRRYPPSVVAAVVRACP